MVATDEVPALRWLSADRVAEGRLRAMVDLRLFGEEREPVRIGRYRVLERLGVGSMGTVYGAMDEELDRKVALKLVHKHLLDEPSIGHARLLREARGLARLAHPNVVTVYEVGVHAEGIFLAMEYIEGSTLGEWLAATARSSAAILTVMIAAGRGLAAAHEAGLVHRDIKPDNIIVDGRGRVRVVDFGLVRAIAPVNGRGLTPLTGAEVILGTPAYMSPEQICGEVPTASSDLYSFCIVLYEALFGERPSGGQLGSDDEAKAVHGRTEGRAATPTQGRRGRRAGRMERWAKGRIAGWSAGPRGRSRRIPGELRRVLRRGLKRRPSLRYPTMMELLSELAGIKRGLVGRGWVGREMLLRLLIGGAGLALALLMAILWIAERRSPSAAVEGATVIAWDRDGRRMLRGDRGGEIWGWEIEGEQALHGRCGETPIIALVAAPAGVVVAAAQGGEVCLWRQAGETLEVRRLPVLARSGTSLAIDPEGRWLVLGDAGGEVRAIELDGGRPLGQWSAGSSIVGARVTREGEIVAVTHEGIHRFRLRAGQGGDENIL